MGYHLAAQDHYLAGHDPNIAAWMIGAGQRRQDELRFHRAAIASARRRDTLQARVGRFLRAIDPRPARATTLDCCAA